MTPGGALFVVAGRNQWQDALLVAAALPGGADVLDLGTLELGPAPEPGTPYGGAHWPAQGYGAVLRLRKVLDRALRTAGVVVLGQDAGRMQRVAAHAARRAGVPVAVVPDGALFEHQARLPARLRLQEAVLRHAGLASGQPLTFGTMHPDLWCAWGDGWVPMLRRFSPGGEVVVTGSPRAEPLAPPPAGADRLLVCSQPVWVHPFPDDPDAGPRWYAWVDAIVRSASPGAVGVRLHPRERELLGELPLTDAVLAARTTGATLADDLAGATSVVAPLSTVLVEAAAAGRRVVSVVPTPACVAIRRTSPATADERLRIHLVDDLPDAGSLGAALLAAGDVTGWGQDFAWTAPGAAARCAEAIAAASREPRTTEEATATR